MKTHKLTRTGFIPGPGGGYVSLTLRWSRLYKLRKVRTANREGDMRHQLGANWTLFVLNVACLFAAEGVASAQNPVVIEHQQPATSAWRITSGFTASANTRPIKGYASSTSVNKAGTITFYVT